MFSIIFFILFHKEVIQIASFEAVQAVKHQSDDSNNLRKPLAINII